MTCSSSVSQRQCWNEYWIVRMIDFVAVDPSSLLPELFHTPAQPNLESAHGQRSDDVGTYALSASQAKVISSKPLASQHQLRGASAAECYGGGTDIQPASNETMKLEFDNRTPSQPIHSHLHEAYSQLQSKVDYMSTNANTSVSGAYDTS